MRRMDWKSLFTVLIGIGSLWLLRKAGVDWGELQLVAMIGVAYIIVRAIAEVGDQIISQLEEINEKIDGRQL